MNIDRYSGHRLDPFGSLSKSRSMPNKQHIEWIKNRRCIVTKKVGPDAHHVLRKSQGLNDYATLPLSHESHMELHSMGVQSFENKHGIDMKDALIATLIDRIVELEKDR